MTRLRISAISYLNTAPLMWDFEHAHAGDNFDLSYTSPSACAAALREGTADIGIIPSAAYALIPNLAAIPGVAIAARRAVRSILLVSKFPLDEVRTVALDSSSLTSVALTKVLFTKYYGGGRSFSAMKPDLAAMLQQHDAALLIGDPALQVDRSRYLTLDLAEEWIRLTGKPFVFAFWGVRRAALKDSQASLDLASIFRSPGTTVCSRRTWTGLPASGLLVCALPKPKCAATLRKTFTIISMRVASKECNCSIAMRTKWGPCRPPRPCVLCPSPERSRSEDLGLRQCVQFGGNDL